MLAAQLEHVDAPAAAEKVPAGQSEQVAPLCTEPAAHVHMSEAPTPVVVKPAGHAHVALPGAEDA